MSKRSSLWRAQLSHYVKISLKSVYFWQALPQWNSTPTQLDGLSKRRIKKIWKFGHMSKLGLPYLPSSLVWTKKRLDKYSYCLPYLPIQKVWTFLNWSLSLNVYFLTLVRILLGNNQDIIRDTLNEGSPLGWLKI